MKLNRIMGIGLVTLMGTISSSAQDAAKKRAPTQHEFPAKLPHSEARPRRVSSPPPEWYLDGEISSSVQVNVDENPALSRQYGVSSIPNLLVFRDGRVVANHLGLASKEELKVLLTQ